MIVVIWTKPSGLYRHRRWLGLHKVGYRERNLHIHISKLAFHKGESHPDTGRSLLSCVFIVQQFRPQYIVRLSGYPLIQESLTYGGGGEDEVRGQREDGVEAVAVAKRFVSSVGVS